MTPFPSSRRLEILDLLNHRRIPNQLCRRGELHPARGTRCQVGNSGSVRARIEPIHELGDVHLVETGARHRRFRQCGRAQDTHCRAQLFDLAWAPRARIDMSRQRFVSVSAVAAKREVEQIRGFGAAWPQGFYPLCSRNQRVIRTALVRLLNSNVGGPDATAFELFSQPHEPPVNAIVDSLGIRPAD